MRLGVALACAALAVIPIVVLQDAQRAVVEHNERREREFEARHPEAP
jgi:hypothetical protein